jgi:translation initiation factor 4E
MSWEDRIEKIGKISTVEEFWGLYSRLIRPSAMRSGQRLHFFRNDSRAMWEDDENKNGGTFTIRLTPNQVTEKWEKLLLDFIGETLDEDFVGAVVSQVRVGGTIVVWHRTSNNPELLLKLVAQLFESAELPFKSEIIWAAHETNEKKPKALFIKEGDGIVRKQ